MSYGSRFGEYWICQGPSPPSTVRPWQSTPDGTSPQCERPTTRPRWQHRLEELQNLRVGIRQSPDRVGPDVHPNHVVPAATERAGSGPTGKPGPWLGVLPPSSPLAPTSIYSATVSPAVGGLCAGAQLAWFAGRSAARYLLSQTIRSHCAVNHCSYHKVCHNSYLLFSYTTHWATRWRTSRTTRDRRRLAAG